MAIEFFVLSRNFGELPVGSVCVADVQYKGRGVELIAVTWIGEMIYVFAYSCAYFAGRSMNVWESPKGCLLFSFTIQMEDGRIVPLVQYVVSLAMTEAIHDVCTKDVSFFLKLSEVLCCTDEFD